MNVLTDLELVNTSATSYASVNILDGSKTIWGTTLPQATPGSGAAFTSYIMNLSTPIKSSPGNALNITQNGTSGLLQWNAQGYAANSGM